MTHFPHPRNKDKKVYLMPDVPHLIKRLRVHILNTGVDFTYEALKENPKKIKTMRDFVKDGHFNV